VRGVLALGVERLEDPVNNRQRDSAAQAFRKLAAELEDSKATAEKKATENADASGLTGETRTLFIGHFVDGWCSDQLTRSAASIRAVVDVYLTAPAVRRDRGRR